MKLGPEISEAAKEVIFAPKKTLHEVIENKSFKIQKKHLIFILFMNLYYWFVPSMIIAIHIFLPIFVMITCGVLYYFAQLASEKYQEEKMTKVSEEHFLYKVAYCFALSNFPGLIFSIVQNVLAFVFAENWFMAIIYAFFLNIVWFVAAIVYPLIMMSIISGKDWDFVGILKLGIESSIITIREFLGYKAMKIIISDLKELSK